MALKRNLLSLIIIAALSGVLIFLTVVFGLTAAKGARIKKEIAARSDAIDMLAKKSKMPLTEESVSFLMDERNKLKSAYSRLKLVLASPLAGDVPAESMDSLQFKERLIQAQKKLREEAKEFSLSLPESLGFAKYEIELSELGEIPVLWRRLAVLDELVYLMTLSGVVSLVEINFIGKDLAKEAAQPISAESAVKMRGEVIADLKGKAAAGPAQNEDFHDEVKVSFKITCAYSSLVEFLYKMRVSPLVLIVDDLDITRAKDTLDKDDAAESMLQADFLVTAEIIM